MSTAPALTPSIARAIAQDVLSRYCELVDHGTGDDALEVFAEDCEVDYGTRRGVMRGREELRPSTISFHEHATASSHHIMSLRADVVGDEIHVRAHVDAWQSLVSGERLTIHGRYDDVIAWRDDRWRIVRRRFRVFDTTRSVSPWAAVERRPIG